MAYLEYGCASLPDHELIPCGKFKRGAISAIGILDESSFGFNGLDFQTVSDWSNGAKYLQAINAGRMAIITKVRGNVPDASPNDIDNPVGCGAQSITSAYDFTISWVDANTTTNTISFYQQLNKRIAGLVLFIPASDEVYVVETATNFVCNPVSVPASNRELQVFNCTARSTLGPNELPMKYLAPSNAGQIFNSCAYPTIPSIGDYVGGGVVFYIDSSLRVAYVMSEQPIGGANYNQAPNTYPWSDASVNIPAVGTTSPNSSKVSFSAANTAAIIAATTGGTFNASNACDTLVLNGYTDWVLPSSLNTNDPSEFGAWKYMLDNVSSLINNYPGTFWSSNQQTSTTGRVVVISPPSAPTATQSVKTNLNSVWPIRSFTY
jgi:hypothetical protein